MSIAKSLLCSLTLFICFGTNAQTYLGLSANFGNRMRYTPVSEGLKRPFAISGSFVLNIHQEVKNGWGIQYGAGAGILGYNLKIISIDTLYSERDISAFLEYATFYGNVSLLARKEISIGEKKLMFGLGGGVSYYYCAFPVTTYGIEVLYPDNSEKKLFHAEVYSPENEIAGFARITSHLELTPALAVGIEYSHHFKPVLGGLYEFYHTRIPSTGKISLYQRELNLVFLIKVSRASFRN